MSDFDKLEFSPFDLCNILSDNDNDPDGNLFKIVGSLTQVILQSRLNQNYRVVTAAPFLYSILILGVFERTGTS